MASKQSLSELRKCEWPANFGASRKAPKTGTRTWCAILLSGFFVIPANAQ